MKIDSILKYEILKNRYLKKKQQEMILERTGLIKHNIIKSKKLSVIVPVYSAESFIAKNLEIMKNSISKYFCNFEIIAVIDGDVDNSFEEATKVKGIKVVGYKDNHGKGNALMYGFLHSKGDYITFIDCDMDIHPDQLKNFIPYLATADLVIGSKRHPFSKLHYPLIRKILSIGFRVYSWLVLGVSLRDTQSGLKLIKREVLEVIMPLLLVKRYAFDIELCFLAQKHGFRTVESPLYVTYNTFRKSTIKFKNIIGMFLDVLAIRYRYSITGFYQKKFWDKMGWEEK
ncbi:MAG: glycosyltransferase family 2 protein [Nanoarchaeota archaeon]|nr:glycosyltransferase family 2 protein [Nanoarchaeota archaeon]